MPTLHRQGFTLVEMMVVVFVVGVLAVTALPRLNLLGRADETAYQQVLRSSLSHARRVAQSQRRMVWVLRDPDTHTLSFSYSRLSDLTAGPYPGSTLTVPLMLPYAGMRCAPDAPHQLCLSSTLDLTGPTELAFTPMGSVRISGSTRFQILMAGTPVGTVDVVAETGHVY